VARDTESGVDAAHPDEAMKRITKPVSDDAVLLAKATGRTRTPELPVRLYFSRTASERRGKGTAASL